jgi:hypothetical protein
LDTKANTASLTFTGTATVDTLNVITGLRTNNPLGITSVGGGLNTLGGLAVNGSALITEKLTVNGTINGYATQAALELKANSFDVSTKAETNRELTNKANIAEVYDLVALKANKTDVFTKTETNDATDQSKRDSIGHQSALGIRY